MTVSLAQREPAEEIAAPVIANDAVNAEYRRLVLACGAPATLARPGQFFQLECPATDAAPFLRRPMSVYRADEAAAEVEFLYKITGLGTRGLATLRPGDRANIFGPLGNGFGLDPTPRHLLVVGRGVGLATLAPLARAARERGAHVTAIISARSAEFVMSADVFAAAGAEMIIVIDDAGTSEVANVEGIVRNLINENGVDAFATCGSTRLMLLLQRVGRELGIRGEVALEQQMACGLGMCFCCVRAFQTPQDVEYRRVCWDGPVFDLAQALPW
jgi:dihydroorotate dehydrogenase electron transfer subunit